MPEMPEVESVVAGIRKHIVNRQITAIEINKGDVIKYPDEAHFIEALKQNTIKAIDRRGKYIILTMANDLLLIIHLRMTGRLLFVPKNQDIDKYSCVIFSLDDGNKFVYADIRRLGTLDVIAQDELPRIKGLYTLGAEPLSKEFTVKYLQNICKHSGKIKPLLLNQKYIAGLGNIYTDEALAISKIHPARLANSLTAQEIILLHKAINKVIGDGIKDGGTSFRDYRNSQGKKGAHQDHLYAYNRKDKPCKFCGTPIKKIVLNGRGTYFCPNCQKLD